MTKSYYILIVVLLVIIGGICFFAYSQSTPKAKVVPAKTRDPAASVSGETINETINAIPLTIKTPKNGAEVESSFISVEGVTAPNADVSVNNKDLLADADGKFKTTLILELGDNPLIVFSSNETGDTASWEASVSYEPIPLVPTPTTQPVSPLATEGEDIATPSSLVTPLPLAKLRGVIEATTSGSLSLKVENNSYMVALPTTAHLVRRYGGKLTPSGFKTGDEVYVVGRFTSEEKTALSAQVVRNLSALARQTHFITKVETITPPRTFVLATKQPLLVPAVATLTNRLGQPITLDFFRPGDKIKIWGLFDPQTKEVMGVSALSNLMIPLAITNSPEATSSAPTTP